MRRAEVTGRVGLRLRTASPAAAPDTPSADKEDTELEAAGEADDLTGLGLRDRELDKRSRVVVKSPGKGRLTPAGGPAGAMTGLVIEEPLDIVDAEPRDNITGELGLRLTMAEGTGELTAPGELGGVNTG